MVQALDSKDPWDGKWSSDVSRARSFRTRKTWIKEFIISGIFAVCLFGSIFTFFKFFTLRDCFEAIKDCFKKKDSGYKGRFSNARFWLVCPRESSWFLIGPHFENLCKLNDLERRKGLMMDLWQRYELEVWWWRHRISKSPSARLENLLEKTSSKIFGEQKIGEPPKSDLIWSQFRWIKLIKSSISTTSCLLV